MPTGRATLQSIDKALADLHSEEVETAKHIGRVTEEIAALREQEASAFRDLASFRLAGDARESIGGMIDRAEAEARRLMSERSTALSDLTKRLDAVTKEIVGLEAERARLSKELEARHVELDEFDDKLLAKVSKEAEYKALTTRLEEADRTADEAERKAELAREDRVEKGKPYEADTLFSYLWERKFGTSEYRAGPLIRMLDRWVARLVRYQDARPNYAMLLQLPDRLTEHAATVRAKAQQVSEEVEAYEEKKRAEAGAAKLTAAVGDAEANLAQAEQALEAAVERRVQVEGERAQLLRGEDDGTRRAVQSLAGALRSAALDDLRRAALMTPEPEDEHILARIEELHGEVANLEADLEHRRDLQHAIEKRRRELEEVRGRFVRERYDNAHWEFDNDLVEDFLKGMLRGALTGSVLWDGIRRHGRYRTGGPMRMPRRGGGPIFRPPGGFGRGGFRTGGGFGGGGRGGGFRTGGGF